MLQIKQSLLKRLAPDYNELKQEREQLRFYERFFPRFVDKQVVRYQQHSDLTTNGEIKNVAVMFTDVRGFTSFSQNVSLAASNSFLNNFYDIVVHHTQAHGGIMDKFMGDGTMSIFGVFDNNESFVARSVAAAQAILRDFKDMTYQKDEPTLFLGVGIAYGPAIVGTFGNGEFVNFTAIGHTVNLAARIQGCVTNNSIYVTKEVTDCLKPGDYKLRGKYALKNVQKRIDLYEVK
jgi:adenylate cyclase